MNDWPGWALKALIAGSVGLLLTVLSEHSRQLREIQVQVSPIQYDLKALTEKSAEQRDAMRSLSLKIEKLMEEKPWKTSTP